MNSPVVAFTSKYGSTRRYAVALAEQLSTPAVELSTLTTAHDADPLIVLAPVYATRILGRRRIIRAIRSAPGRAALVVVGLSPADDPGRGDLAALRRELRRTPEAPAAQLLLHSRRLQLVDAATLEPVVTWALGGVRVDP